MRKSVKSLTSQEQIGKTRLRSRIRFAVILATLTFVGNLYALRSQADVQVTSKIIGDATHLEFSGLTAWEYNVQRAQNKVSITLTNVKKTEIQKLINATDERIKEVRIKEIDDGKSSVLEFVFASESMNIFDYQTEAPTRLVFDIYEDAKVQKDKKPVAQEKAKSTKKEKAKRATASVEKIEIPKTQPVIPAPESKSTEEERMKMGIFDGGDANLGRFSIKPEEVRPEAYIKTRQNIYIKFPQLIIEHSYLQELNANPPQYEVPAETGEENMQFRLLMRLHKEKKGALFLRTLRFFRERYPISKYDETIAFAEADAYYYLWERDGRPGDFEDAIARYKSVLTKYPQNPLANRTLMFIALNYLARGNQFGALTIFQSGIRDYPNSPYYWQMRVGLAEALRTLNRPEEALKEFKSIEDDPKSARFGVEAGFRQGDVRFHQGQYKEAIAEYQEALKKYPKSWAEFPNAFFNISEAYFRLENYRESLEAYKNFLQRFSSHSFGGYAMTRIGEILEIFGAPQQKVMGAFLESFFRYKGTPGAALARLRLNASRFKDMKPKELNAALEEISSMLKDSKLEGIEEYNTVVQSDGFHESGDFNRSLDMLVTQFQKDPHSPYLGIMRHRIEKNLTTQLTKSNDRKDYLESLKIFTKFKSTWLAKTPRLDTRFQVGRAFEGMGVPEQAESFYRECLNDLYAASDKEVSERKVFEEQLTADQLNLRLASVGINEKDRAKSAAYLRDIKHPEKLNPEENLERSLIVAKIAEGEGQHETAYVALKDVVDKWKGRPALLAEPWLRIGKILAGEKKNNEALIWLEKIANTYKDTLVPRQPASADSEEIEYRSPVDVSLVRQAMELQGDLLSKDGKVGEAAKAYQYMIDKLGEGYPVASVRYKLGRMYFDRGNLKEAAKHWDQLKKDENGETWAKIAQENLEHAQWKDKYKRYMSGRIPSAPLWAPEQAPKKDGK